ncbi:hypothetical protein ACFQMF_03600 [Halorubrum rutilum]|uniref:Integral membrane protein n=1 Tax=Halorubrum rutilum TaxID=1364933 RepID=A0ABD6AHJ9_9EURY|nr:hypothetical protein [Halorubrum rutilum]
MTSDAPEGSSERGAARAESRPREGSYAGRADAWLSSNGTYVEAGVAATAAVAGAVALPVVAFGALTAIGGETSILTGGLIVAAVCLGLLTLLAGLLLVRASLEVRYRGAPFGGDDAGVSATLYGAARTAEAIAAGTFLVGLVASLASVASIGRVPSPILLAVGAGGVALPTLVLLRATGELATSAFELI